MIWVLVALLLLVVVLTMTGVARNQVKRSASQVGIEDEEVIKSYDRISRWPQFRLLRKLVILEIKKFKPSGLLADLGCGPAYLLSEIAWSIPQLSLIGLDISQSILDAARQNLIHDGLSERVVFRQGDIEALPFGEDSLDFVVSTLSLHHWLNPDKAVEEIYRVLKRGGQFLIFDTRRDAWWAVYWLIRFAQTFIVPEALRRAREPESSFKASYTFNEAKALLSNSSFKHCQVKTGPGWLFLSGVK